MHVLPVDEVHAEHDCECRPIDDVLDNAPLIVHCNAEGYEAWDLDKWLVRGMSAVKTR